MFIEVALDSSATEYWCSPARSGLVLFYASPSRKVQ
jgi:hypothetical protein